MFERVELKPFLKLWISYSTISIYNHILIFAGPPYEKDTFVPSLQYRDDVVSLASSGSVVINLSYAFTYRGSARHDAHPYFSNYWQRPAL